MKVTLYYGGSKMDYDEVDIEELINYMTINLQRVPNVGEEISLMFDRYWINAKVAQVYTNWTEPGNERFREHAWGDRYALSLTDIEIMEDAYESTYYNDEYGFTIAEITKRTQGGYGLGKSHKEYNYKGKWYKKFDKFLEAIKDVEFKG